MRKRTNKKPEPIPDSKIDPKSARTWRELAEPYFQMRIAAAVQGYGAAVARVSKEEVNAVCRRFDPDQI